LTQVKAADADARLTCGVGSTALHQLIKERRTDGDRFSAPGYPRCS
jgi:hypothetical protein